MVRDNPHTSIYDYLRPREFGCTEADVARIEAETHNQITLFCWGEYSVTGGSFLGSGYTFAILLLLAYFLWEDGPMHRSRRIENTYLFSIFVFTFFVSYITDETEEELLQRLPNHNGDDHKVFFHYTRASKDLQFLMRLLILVHLLHRYTSLKIHPMYFAKDHVRHQTIAGAHAHRGPSPRAVRAAADFQGLIEDLMRLNEARGVIKFIGPMLGPLMFFILMVLDFARFNHTIAYYIQPVAQYSEATLFLYWMALNMRSFCELGPKSRELHQLVRTVVRLPEADVAETVIHMLNTTSIASFIEVAIWESVVLLIDRVVEDERFGTSSKAILVDALQKRGLRGRRKCQWQVQRLMLSAKGSKLTELKNSIDEGGEYYNLFKLMYSDVADDDIRYSILEHLAVEARAVRERLGRSVGVKVLSDVDDTLYSSGGRFPAGCDKTFPKHAVYPGCLALFRVLDNSYREGKPSCNLVFISARPHVYKNLAENHSYQLFKRLLDEGRLHDMPTLLPGELWRGLQAFITYPFKKTKAWKSVGFYKKDTYLNYRELYREYDFVFFGDNGQADFFAGQLMVEEPASVCTPAPREASIRALQSTSGRTTTASRAASRAASRRSATGTTDGPSLLTSRKEPERRSVVVGSLAQSGQIVTRLKASLLDRVTTRSRSVAAPTDDPAYLTPQLLGVVIHEVMFPPEAVLAKEPEAERDDNWRADLRRRRIFLHRGYVGAALALHEVVPELVSERHVAKVAQSAADDFDAIRLTHPELANGWMAAEEQLVCDLRAANELIVEAGLRPLKKFERTKAFLARTRLTITHLDNSMNHPEGNPLPQSSMDDSSSGTRQIEMSRRQPDKMTRTNSKKKGAPRNRNRLRRLSSEETLRCEESESDDDGNDVLDDSFGDFDAEALPLSRHNVREHTLSFSNEDGKAESRRRSNLTAQSTDSADTPHSELFCTKQKHAPGRSGHRLSAHSGSSITRSEIAAQLPSTIPNMRQIEESSPTRY